MRGALQHVVVGANLPSCGSGEVGIFGGLLWLLAE